jgi:hypothetical protein
VEFIAAVVWWIIGLLSGLGGIFSCLSGGRYSWSRDYLICFNSLDIHQWKCNFVEEKVLNDNQQREVPEHQVIPFTGQWKGTMKMPTNKEQIEGITDKINKFHVNSVLQTVTAHLFHSLAAAGFPILNESRYKSDIAMVNESIKSLILKAYGQKHPIQDIAREAGFKDWFDPKMVVSAPSGPPPKSYA